LDRFLVVADGLAGSTALSGVVKISVRPPEAGGQEQVAVQFPALDLQAGFSALLRQCHGASSELASYTRTRNILGRAAHDSSDGHREARLAMLDAWGQAVKMLRRRSVRYLVHEAFAAREGWEAFRPDAEAAPSPDSLLQTFNYGDLIHWGDGRDDVRGPDDDYAAAKQRFEFFVAAAGLTHVYIGFAELIRAATRT
jgi:hypothetical protein